MATHSSVLAWRIPGTGEPGGLQSMGSHRVGQDRSDLAAAAAGKWKRLTTPAHPLAKEASHKAVFLFLHKFPELCDIGSQLSCYSWEGGWWMWLERDKKRLLGFWYCSISGPSDGLTDIFTLL